MNKSGVMEKWVNNEFTCNECIIKVLITKTICSNNVQSNGMYFH